MGYCYEAYGSRRLVCDKCGHAGGVRRRKCKYKVVGDSLRVPSGQRPVMHYCSPPALCGPCYKELGGLNGVHGDNCREGAAQSQLEADEIERRIHSGDMKAVAAWGDWQEGVDKGFVGVLYEGRYDDGSIAKGYYLVPKEAYEKSRWFSDSGPLAETWENYPGRKDLSLS
jgi:hypothetical protein